MGWGNKQEKLFKFTTVGEAEKAERDFQKKWKNASAEKCLALGRDEELLEATEAFENDIKASYRGQRRGPARADKKKGKSENIAMST